VNPTVQFGAYIEFAVLNNLISTKVAQLLEVDYQLCVKYIAQKNFVAAAISCHLIVGAIFLENPGMSFYDIRLICPKPLQHDCYNFSAATAYMNQPAVRKHLNVGNRPWRNPETLFSVLSAINGDEESSYQSCVPLLLASGIKVMFYNGEFDLAANYVGGEAWLAAMSWPGQQQFNATQFAPWVVEGQEAGFIKSVDNLTLVRVFGAGHMVPMNQPKNALAMLAQFLDQSRRR